MKSKRHIKGRKGFSLVELLVVVSIFLIITAITLFKQSKFSSDILITNSAYEVALSIRQAQVYGVGSKQDVLLGAQGYGMYFFNPDYYIMYSETPDIDPATHVKTYLFNYGSGDDEGRYTIVGGDIALQRDQHIRDFCGIPFGGGDAVCYRGGSLEYLNVGFMKPNLYAVLSGQISGGGVQDFERATITVESTLGDKCRTVEVNHIGQISVKDVVPGENGC